MKKLLFALAILCPAIVLAQSPFDGTWKTLPDQSKLSQKPVTFSLAQGTYHNLTTVPNIHVKADGTDQPLTELAYDSLAVSETDGRAIHLVYKKAGKTGMEIDMKLSEDGKTLVSKGSFHHPDRSQAVTSEYVFERVGAAPAGSHAVSGSWRAVKYTESENDLLATYKRSGNQMTWSTPAGMSWTATLDGADHPFRGSYMVDRVAVKEIGKREIEVRLKREGKLIWVDRITISADGRTMTTVSENKQTGRVSTDMAEKQ